MANIAQNSEGKNEYTNSLIHTIDVYSKHVNCIVKIRLNDEYKNGHQDFAITGTFWTPRKKRIDKNMIVMGACHDTILKHFPDLKVFVDLHLCDCFGAPMFALENGFYHIKNGFSSGLDKKKSFCEYYRVTEEQFEKLEGAESEIQFAIMLEDFGILSQWEEEAKKAITKLEQYTGKKFLFDTSKPNYKKPTTEEIQEEQQKIKDGYYTKEQKQKRKNEQIEKIKAEIYEEERKEIQKIKLESEVKREILRVGGVEAYKNMIFYNHSKLVAFNWRSYDNISDDLIKTIKANAILPNGVAFK